MTHGDKGNFRKKHPPDRRVKEEIIAPLKRLVKDNGVTCAAAHGLAGDLGLDPSEVGFAMDHLEIPITACQMGLFGYSPVKKIVEPADAVSPELKRAIESETKDRRIPCEASWGIATAMGIKKMAVSAACEALGIRIRPCQLGAF